MPTFGPPTLPSPGHSPALNAGGGGGALAPRVVIADDEAHIRLVVGEKFRSEGCTVLEARDGEEALELVRTNLPHLLVTDLQMPYMNGLELCMQLATDPRTAEIPAILLTARGHILDDEQLSKSCIRKVISKPFSAKALFEHAVSLLAPVFGTATPPMSISRSIKSEAA